MTAARGGVLGGVGMDVLRLGLGVMRMAGALPGGVGKVVVAEREVAGVDATKLGGGNRMLGRPGRVSVMGREVERPRPGRGKGSDPGRPRGRGGGNKVVVEEGVVAG
jgi:hypothetical protein